jgi:predicted amidohydrolase YtcJ
MRSALFTVFVSVGAVAAGPLANAQTPVKAGPQPSSTIAVVNVTVIPMDRERAIRDQTVLIRGDRIAAIGSTSEISVSEGALVIDGNGRFFCFLSSQTHTSICQRTSRGRPQGLTSAKARCISQTV